MDSIAIRSRQAEKLWQRGDAALAGRDETRAYRFYTDAHDLVTDCPKLHLTAHRRLRSVTRRHSNKGEFITDTLLVTLAPLGIFELIALAMRSKVGRDALCRRRA